MALPINKDIALQIAKQKAKEAIAQKAAKAAMEQAKKLREAKTLPKPEGVIDIKALSKTVRASQPDDQKPKGLAKFGKLITDNGLQLAQAALPAAKAYAVQLAIDTASENLPDVCPSQEIIDSIITPLTNLIESINSTATITQDINKLMQDVSTGVTVVSTTSTILNALIPGLTTAADASPLAPGFLVSAIDKIDYVNKKIIFKNDGTPRLPEIISNVGSVTIATSLVSFYLKQVKDILDKVIAIIKKCSPSSTLPELNAEVISLSKQQEQSTANQDNVYKGFLIKIVEVKFNEQLNQRKAVAYNGNGIPVLETELSFTTNTQTLVNDLKKIIDESGLIGDYQATPQPPAIDQDLLPDSGLENDQVRLSVLDTRIAANQSKVDDEYKKFLALNKELPISPPNYPAVISTLNIGTVTGQFNTFANEVLNEVNYSFYAYRDGQQVEEFRYSEQERESANKIIPELKQKLNTIRSLIDNINSFKGNKGVIEGTAVAVDINTQSSFALPTPLNPNP